MAVINDEYPTLLDAAASSGADGKILALTEYLTKDTPVLEDAVVQEGNRDTGYEYAFSTALPSVEWGKANRGTLPTKGTDDKAMETCGWIEGRSEIHDVVADIGGRRAQTRLRTEKKFATAMRNEMASSIFYASDAATPEKIRGLTPRLNLSAGNVAANQIVKVDAAAAGSDQASIWIIGWGLDKVFGMFPKGMPGGLTHKDLGEIDSEQADGRKLRVLASLWRWWMGLVVMDWRYIVRICNIDRSLLSKTADTLVPALMDGLSQMKSLTDCKPIIYCDRQIDTYLWHQSRTMASNSSLRYDMIEGKPVGSVKGIPIHIEDSLRTNEDVVV